MSPRLALLQAILREDSLSADALLGVLEQALVREADPLDYCIARFGISQALAYARAAQWAGVAFEAALPRPDEPAPVPTRIDALATVRAVAVCEGDRDLTYLAPGFQEFIGLRAYALRDPLAADRVRVVPPQALRRHVAMVNAPHLMASARQRLARRWPHASAHLDLPLTMRLVFVLVVLTLIATTMVAPFTGNPVLIAFAILIVAAPAILRLLAMGVAPSAASRPRRREEDADLPVYSVLLPLRDEAAMVPQLYKAVAAMDYPALCSKRTKDVAVCN